MRYGSQDHLSGACQQHSEIESYGGVPGIQDHCVLKRTDRSVRVPEALIGQSQEIKTLSILWLVTQVLQKNRHRVRILLLGHQDLPQSNPGRIHIFIFV